MRKDEEGNPCPETLGEYRNLIAAMVGEENQAIQWLDEQIKEKGEDEIVLAPDSQMRMILIPMMVR